MKPKTSLKIILIISIIGLLFSGYLSYSEIFTGTCAIGGTCTSVAKIPACVYGFFMYIIILIISIMGLAGKEQEKTENEEDDEEDDSDEEEKEEDDEDDNEDDEEDDEVVE